MDNTLDTLDTLTTAAAGAEALPLELLQPLDSSNPVSTPVRLSGPEQRLTVTPDPGVGDASLLPPSQLLIGKDGVTRSIWPVHLAGWQALGWELLSSTSGSDDPPPLDGSEDEPEPPEQEQPETEPAPVDLLDRDPEPTEMTDSASPSAEPTSTLTSEPTDTSSDAGEALLASEPTDFQAMTKAQIVEFCSSVYGVELDGSQTKAELVVQAMALEAQASGSEGSSDAADLAAQELGDALL
ncbi:MAG: hypothetical protein VKM92_02210 [Cyanobacteriota bacterium]|nr:hypothetical protein [Cyanobacteriota bacterium]